jgi:hypothetical protein
VSNKNLETWDALRWCDAHYTKDYVDNGVELTAVDPMYRIKKMTEVFGPVGKNWDYTANYEQVTLPDETVLVTASVLIDAIENVYGSVMSSKKLFWWTIDKDRNKIGNIDTDAYKKALTDALGKALSHLGVCADAYMGSFSDDDSVETEPETPEDTMAVKRFKTSIMGAKTSDHLDHLESRVTKQVTEEADYQSCMELITKQRERVNGEPVTVQHPTTGTESTPV